jgi:hypothetical protein
MYVGNSAPVSYKAPLSVKTVNKPTAKDSKADIQNVSSHILG